MEIERLVRHREAVLSALLGLWGLSLLILTPPFQVPDEFAHFDRAFQVSEFTMRAVRQGDSLGGTLPRLANADHGPFNFLPFFSEHKLSRREYFKMRAASPAMTHENLASREFYNFDNTAVYSPVLYFCSGAGIAAARFFSMTALDGFYLARLFNLLAALGIFYGALRLLRRLPELQLMLFLIAGTPMMTFELMSISADCMTFSIAVLVIACIVNLSLEWSLGVYITLAGSCVLLGLCKQGYLLLPCSSLLFWKSIPGSFFRKMGHVLFVIACALVPTLVWGRYVQSVFVPHLKHVHIDPVAQMRYFIGHWPVLLPYFLKELFYERGRVYGQMMYGFLGWLDTPLPFRQAVAYGCLCLGSVWFLLERKTSSSAAAGGGGLVISWATRALLLSVVFGSVLSVALITYATFNPVGIMALEGIQGRYFLPVLPLLFLALYRLLPMRLSRSSYLRWAVFCVGTWACFSGRAAWILCARYWVE